MNPAKKSFLLLVIGLDMLAWIFPIHSIAALFSFVTIWAVMGKKWALAVSLFAFAPDLIQAGYATALMAPSIIGVINQCSSFTDNTLNQACFNNHIGAQLPSFVTSPPKIQAIPHLSIPPILALPIIFPLWLFFMYVGFVRPILRIKKRIRASITHRYAFRD